MSFGLAVQAGADVNVLNDMGDTPLHRAAFTGRKVKYVCFIFLSLNHRIKEMLAIRSLQKDVFTVSK